MTPDESGGYLISPPLLPAKPPLPPVGAANWGETPRVPPQYTSEMVKEQKKINSQSFFVGNCCFSVHWSISFRFKAPGRPQNRLFTPVWYHRHPLFEKTMSQSIQTTTLPKVILIFMS